MASKLTLKILFEDNHLLVVNKPPGLLSQGDLSGDLDVLTLARQLLKQRDHKPGNVYLGLVHRLDRPVGGVMVIAKTSKAAGRLSKQFRERETKKIYRAMVEGRPTVDSAELKHKLHKDRATRTTRVLESSAVGGAWAVLAYRLIGTSAESSLLEVDLHTGISHQIRAQLSAIGHPIVGDQKYGSNERFIKGQIALYAASLSIVHPVKPEPVTFAAPPPPWWPRIDPALHEQ